MYHLARTLQSPCTLLHNPDGNLIGLNMTRGNLRDAYTLLYLNHNQVLYVVPRIIDLDR